MGLLSNRSESCLNDHLSTQRSFASSERLTLGRFHSTIASETTDRCSTTLGRGAPEFKNEQFYEVQFLCLCS